MQHLNRKPRQNTESLLDYITRSWPYREGTSIVVELNPPHLTNSFGGPIILVRETSKDETCVTVLRFNKDEEEQGRTYDVVQESQLGKLMREKSK